jgi:hypothetical protein
MAALPASMPLEVPCPIEGCGARMVTTATLRFRHDMERGGPSLTTLGDIDAAPLYAHADTHTREEADHG